MDGFNGSPNQWNPETAADDANFEQYVRRLAAMSDEDFAAQQEALLRHQPVPPGLGALERLAYHIDNYLREVERTHPCPFPELTPARALERLGISATSDGHLKGPKK